MHPSDIADILEDLPPGARSHLVTLDEEVAAEALEEVDHAAEIADRVAGSGQAADIVEEMDPGAAADLLAELSDERSEAILEEMEPEERHEVEELLEFREDSAAGRMTTEFVRCSAPRLRRGPRPARVRWGHRGGDRNLSHRGQGCARGVGTLARLVLAMPETRWTCSPNRDYLLLPLMRTNDVAELFDKYNLHALPLSIAGTAWSGWFRPTM